MGGLDNFAVLLDQVGPITLVLFCAKRRRIIERPF